MYDLDVATVSFDAGAGCFYVNKGAVVNIWEDALSYDRINYQYVTDRINAFYISDVVTESNDRIIFRRKNSEGTLWYMEVKYK